ncbi:hypothetical protein Q5P01_016673 [Channa striata]|uniref:Uncharacterized protein n=1 Tax=Channa striata TaxID=64152 RepID=A0AA88M9C3_CHASR|nr:hypothetical protein Q5P01_016673 [Channa striata]
MEGVPGVTAGGHQRQRGARRGRGVDSRRKYRKAETAADVIRFESKTEAGTATAARRTGPFCWSADRTGTADMRSARAEARGPGDEPPGPDGTDREKRCSYSAEFGSSPDRRQAGTDEAPEPNVEPRSIVVSAPGELF